MKTHLLILFLLFLLFSGHDTRASLVIDSAVSSNSTCVNNGTITVYARGSSVLSYAIVSGTIIFPPQVSNTFSSLLPGTYRIQVTDLLRDTAFVTASLTGSYKRLRFEPKVVYPGCRRNTNLLLVGNADSGTGLTPLTWELVAPSPIIAVAQRSDTFHINRPGTYTVRCTDACGNVQSRFYTVDSSYASSNFKTHGAQISRMGCDSAWAGFYVDVNGDSNNVAYPLVLSVNNGHGNSVTYVQNSYPANTDFFDGQHSLYVSSYGMAAGINIYVKLGNTYPNDNLSITLTDACGDTISETGRVPAPTIVVGMWQNHPADSCRLGNGVGIGYYMPRPNTWVLTPLGSNAIIDSGHHDIDTNTYTTGNGVQLFDLIPGRSYTITCRGTCGDVVSQSFTWPAPDATAPYIAPSLMPGSCLDSTVAVNVSYGGFPGYPTFTILSGPATAHSNKPGYAYNATYTYPRVFRTGSLKNSIQIADLGPGSYAYTLADSCGHVLTGTIQIAPSDVVSMSHSISYIKGCEDANIIASTVNSAAVSYTVYNPVTGVSFGAGGSSGDGHNNIYNVPSGDWILTSSLYSPFYNFTDSGLCTTVYDTIHIPGYTDPLLTPLSASSCGSVVYIDAVPDVTKGIAPFTYDIISGPETYPEQSSSRFEVHHYGTYIVRILDACGTGTARLITIDSLTPLVRTEVRLTDSCFRAAVRGVVYTSDTALTLTLTTVAGCDSIIYIDSVHVRNGHDSLPVLLAGIDTFCSQRGGVIAAAHSYSGYLWSDGSTGPSIRVSAAGIYHLTVTDAEGCLLSGERTVALTDSPYVTSGWITDGTVCTDDPLFIHLTVNDPRAQYQWDVADEAQYNLDRIVTDSGIYTFSISNQCGISLYVLNAVGKDCQEDLYIPNAFSPNGDGVNDVFQVYTSYKLKNVDIKVFDRWGEKVFEGSNDLPGWDGSYRGQRTSAGVYVYEVSAVWLTGREFRRRGSLTLIR